MSFHIPTTDALMSNQKLVKLTPNINNLKVKPSMSQINRRDASDNTHVESTRLKNSKKMQDRTVVINLVDLQS